MNHRHTIALAALFALVPLAPSAVASAAGLCTGKTPPAVSACYTVGRCDPRTGEFALVDRTPSTPAPACKKYTGGCDATTGVFTTADIVCPRDQECSLATGRCALIDICKEWVRPTDADKCKTYTCNQKTGETVLSRRTCGAGQFCATATGQCNPICVDNDLANKEKIPGQLTIKGVASSADRCTSDGNLEQVGCDADGSAKVYTARACSKGACINGICLDLCTNVPPNDACTTFNCNPLTGEATQTQAPRPTVNACQTVGACDTITGYAISQKTGTPSDACHTAGTCNIRTGEFAQDAVRCPEGQECSVQAGGCVAINECVNWTRPEDQCNTYSCDPPTGRITKLPVQPPTTAACQILKACDTATGFTIIDTCPTGQECSLRAGGCVAIGTSPPAEPEAPATVAVTPPIPDTVAETAAVAAPLEPAIVATPPPIPDTVAETAAVAAPTSPTVEEQQVARERLAQQPTQITEPNDAQPAELSAEIPAVETAPAAAPPPDSSAREEAGDSPAPDALGADCFLRARRICALQSASPTDTKDLRTLSDFDIREALIADSPNPISLGDPEVQQTLTQVGESFTDPRHATEYAKDDDRSRLAYCIDRVAQFCKRPDAEKTIVVEDCSDPRYAAENTARCPFRTEPQAACIGQDNTLLQSTSSIFEVKPLMLSLPATFKAEQLGSPQLLESPDDPLRQYILIPSDAATATGIEVLAIDPRTGLTRMLGIDKGQLFVVRDSTGAGTILMMAKATGITYLPNAWSAVEEHMKGAVSIDDGVNNQGPAILISDAVSWNTVAIPADEQILSAHPIDKGVIAVTGNADGTLKGIWYFASISDATGKFILFAPEAAGHTLRKALFTTDNGKRVADLVLMSKDKAALLPTIVHSDDVLAEPAIFTVLADPESGTKALKKAISGDWVYNSAERASAKEEPKDKEQLKKTLSEVISAGTVGIPAALYTFIDNGAESSALVIQPNGLDHYELDGGTVIKREGEFLSSGTGGEACRKIVAALPVDANNWGGKDLAVVTSNGAAVSIAFYPNMNQAPMIEQLTAKSVAGGAQLSETTLWEQGEIDKCKWEAFQVMPDGSLKDVSAQLDNPNSCSPTFKSIIPSAPQTSLMPKPSILSVAANWLVTQINIGTAYAEEPTTTTTNTYLFRFTATDPMGVTASAQETVQVTTPATPSVLPMVKVISMEMLTPQRKDAQAQATGTHPPPETPLSVETAAGESRPAAPPPENKAADAGAESSSGSAQESAPQPENNFGSCSLSRKDATASTMSWLWLLPLLPFIPARILPRLFANR